MKPGKEMDALVAEKIFGLKLKGTEVCGRDQVVQGGEMIDVGGFGWANVVPRYSTDKLAALALLERFPGTRVTLVHARHDHNLGGWMVNLYSRTSRSISTAGTLPEAICRAALLSVGVDVNQP